MGFYPITALFFSHCTFQSLFVLLPLASGLLFLCEPTFQYLFGLFFKTFQYIYRPQNPTFQIFMWQSPSLLSSTHRQTPASNLRLLGPFILSSASYFDKFSHFVIIHRFHSSRILRREYWFFRSSCIDLQTTIKNGLVYLLRLLIRFRHQLPH